MRKLLFTLTISLLTFSLNAQESIHPGLSGQDLLDALIQDYLPATVLGYAAARDEMYGNIDNRNDSITCVYTGYQIYVPFNDPNPRNFTNSASPIMNAEHTWPRSKGANQGSNAFSNLHHIFPTNGDANAGRGSFPFADINDSDTDRWYLGTNTSNTIPAANIDSYSELRFNTSFEVPEAHKGNVARAMFYFYTMYKAMADAADPNFFDVQKDVLRNWSYQDPVDQVEVDRTNAIAAIQDGKVNPFVMDTTLIARAYFGAVSNISEVDGGSIPSGIQLHQNFPNPFNPNTQIKFDLPQASRIQINIFDLNGRVVRELADTVFAAGSHTLQWNSLTSTGAPAASGVYVYVMQTDSQRFARKMLLVR